MRSRQHGRRRGESAVLCRLPHRPVLSGGRPCNNAFARGGRIFVVTKRPDWYQEHMPQWFNDVAIAGGLKRLLIASARAARE